MFKKGKTGKLREILSPFFPRENSCKTKNTDTEKLLHRCWLKQVAMGSGTS